MAARHSLAQLGHARSQVVQALLRAAQPALKCSKPSASRHPRVLNERGWQNLSQSAPWRRRFEGRILNFDSLNSLNMRLGLY